MEEKKIQYVVTVKVDESWKASTLIFRFDELSPAVRLAEAFLSNLDKENSALAIVSISLETVDDEESDEEVTEDE